MKTKRRIFSLRIIVFLIALAFFGVSVLIGQSVGKDKPSCPEVDKNQIRKTAKQLKIQRSHKSPLVSRYSYEHGESIPNYM